jgi:hypothetical protein
MEEARCFVEGCRTPRDSVLRYSLNPGLPGGNVWNLCWFHANSIVYRGERTS